MTFHDLSHDLKFSCHFGKLSKSSLSWGIFSHKLAWILFCPQVASTSAIIYAQHITIIFHDIPWPKKIHSMTFQAWKLKYFISVTFQVFHDPHEPFNNFYNHVRIKPWLFLLRHLYLHTVQNNTIPRCFTIFTIVWTCYPFSISGIQYRMSILHRHTIVYTLFQNASHFDILLSSFKLFLDALFLSSTFKRIFYLEWGIKGKFE